MRLTWTVLLALALLLLAQMDETSCSAICYTIEGRKGCPYYERAVELGEALIQHLGYNVTVRGYDYGSWYSALANLQAQIPGGQDHRTSPFIYEGCHPDEYAFIGGFDTFSQLPFTYAGEAGDSEPVDEFVPEDWRLDL